MERAVYLVLCDGMIVLGAYWRADPAHIHARTVTGASVTCVQVLEHVPAGVLELLNEDFLDDDDTPVTEMPPALKKQ